MAGYIGMKKFISLFVLANFLFFWTLPASADVVDEYNAGTIYSYQNTNSTDNLFGGINLYGYDKETKTVNKTTYSLLLNDTDYNNDSNYDFIKYFKFDNSTGNYRLVQGDSNDYDLAYYVELNNMYEYDPSFDETTPLIADFIGISYTEANDNNLGGYYDEDNGYSGSIDCDIQGDFVQNIHDNTSNSYGVGVYLKGGEMQNITGNFISNIGTSKNQDSYGAGIYNDGGTIGNVSGNFIGNVNNAFQDARGGGIYSDRGYFGDITASFVANGVVAQEGKAYGGAIYIAGDDRAEIIGKIEGDFIQNYANANANTARGGAIHINSITTNSINGNFIGNTAQGTTGYGGALYSTDSIVTNGIRGDFIQNKASASTESARGGAIYSDKGEIASISGNFIENKAASDENVAYGGAIYNSGIIGNITGNHYYNSAQGTYSEGGSTRNTGTIGNINGDYIGNGAISNKISPLNEDEKSYAYGGGIYNNKGVISDINGDFVQNFATSNTSDARGGGIYQNEGTIGNISGNYIENNLSANNRAYGGAIYNGKGQMGNINGTFINNYVISKGSGGDNKAEGGAIYLDKGKIGSFDSDGNTVGGIINSTFAGNNAISEFGEAKGGAIYTSSDLNIIADNGETIFEDNYTISAGEKKENAIFVGEENATLRLEAKNEGEIRFEDEIEGDLGFNLALKGDDKSKIIINNDIINADISVDNTNVYVSEGQYIAQNPTLSVNSGILNINHLANQTLHYDSFKNTGLINFNSIDVDLKNETMGRITADTYGDMTNGVIDVKGLNLISTTERDNTNILFADSSFSDTVKYTGDSTLYTPIYKYDVSYQINDNDDMGYFVFNRGNIREHIHHSFKLLNTHLNIQMPLWHFRPLNVWQ